MNFEFNEKTHRYYLDGKQMTGVTTILGILAKPALISWAANMAVDYLKKNPEDWEGAKKAHITKRDKAADTGTLMHAIAETMVKNAIKNTGGYITEEFTVDESLSPEVSKMVGNFLNWAKGIKFLASEERVYHAELFYAGTFDFVCEIEGRKYIGDLKTSSGIYGKEYNFQMAGYRKAMEYSNPELEKNIHGAIVVRCGKKGDFETKESFDYETDLQGFLACLKLYRIINN